MKKIIHEIRQQPHHVRELATLLCTIAVVAVVGIVWFRSFQRDMYALLNPQEAAAEDAKFARESTSLFGSMLQALDKGRAQLSGLFMGSDGDSIIINSPTPTPNNAGSVYPLPVTGRR